MATELNIDVHERLVKTAAEFSKGTVTYVGRKAGWHLLGSVIGKFGTWKELVKVGGADFQVVKKQLEFLGIPVEAWGVFRIDRELQDELNAATKLGLDPAWGENAAIQFQERINAIRRKAVFLAPATGSYQVIQHTDGFETLDQMVGEINGAHYETMGTLDKGRIVWGQVDPNVKIRVGDDESDVLLTFQTSHDGSKSFEIYLTIYRYVCRNTFRAGNLKKLANALKVRHTKNAGKRIASLKAEIEEVRLTATSIEDQLRLLASKRVTHDGLEAIMGRLFPKSIDPETGLEKSSKHRDNVLADVLSLYERNDGDAYPEQRGTPYNLLNAVTEYTDHVRGKDAIDRAESGLFGSGAKLKVDALAAITEYAKGAPEMLRRGGGTQTYSPDLFNQA